MELFQTYPDAFIYAGLVFQAWLVTEFRRTRLRIVTFMFVQAVLALGMLAYQDQLWFYTTTRRGPTITDPQPWIWWIIWAVLLISFIVRLISSSSDETKHL